MALSEPLLLHGLRLEMAPSWDPSSPRCVEHLWAAVSLPVLPRVAPLPRDAPPLRLAPHLWPSLSRTVGEKERLEGWQELAFVAPLSVFPHVVDGGSSVVVVEWEE